MYRSSGEMSYFSCYLCELYCEYCDGTVSIIEVGTLELVNPELRSLVQNSQI